MIIKDFYRVEQPNGGYIEYSNLSDVPQGAIYTVIQREVKTPEEIEAENLAIQIDLQDENYVLSLEEAGLQVVRRHRKRLRRRVEENTTSFDDAKTVRKLLRPIWQELKDGDFDWALTDAQAIDQTLYNNAVDRETNWLITRIQELIVANP